ncbi:MAG: hypothetical protein ACREQ2_06060 [Candidatus Binatia bacterium]
MRTLLLLAFAAAIILGYGYYHAATHGWLYVSLLDTSVKPYSGNIRDAEIRLLDGDGQLLADAKSDHQYGVVRLIHPEAGDCSAVEASASSSPATRDQWQKCFETLSIWLMGWAARVRGADVKFADCDLKAVPVTLQENREDWWFWWVPLPHVGGKPLTYFNLSISVNGANCTAAKGPKL